MTEETETTRTISTCISDRPVKNDADDKLEAAIYVNGLFNFILQADTPVTIGIQGGWGSGKTSLIQMLQDKLTKCDSDRTLCVFINAWEHSLLQQQDNKVQVALSLLQGLVDGFEKQIKDSAYIDNDLKAKALGGGFTKAIESVKKYLPSAIRAASTLLGNPVEIPKSSEQEPDAATAVRNLRSGLQETVSTITTAAGQKIPKRFVCFIDDLDRVQPETAIEILDVTKNIFDIENCIFILAIDYDVVVKGLEGKFGKKNEENEREFRQYFDKIIQIPFTMPIGAYKNKMDKLLQACFGRLYYTIEDGEHTGAMENIRDAAMAATDGIPRSVKRIINTVSLLQSVSQANENKKEQNFQEFEIRFIVVALHINFPEICRRLMENSAFTSWRLKMEGNRWGVENESIKPGELKELYPKAFDEEWELVLYGLCQKSGWLRGKALALSNLLNALRTALMRGRSKQEDEKLDELAVNTLEDVLGAIRVVSIDGSSQPVPESSTTRTDSVTRFCHKWHEKLRWENAPEFSTRNWAKKNGSNREYVLLPSGKEISQCGLFWYKQEQRLVAYLYIKSARGIAEIRERMIQTGLPAGVEYMESNEYECTLAEQWPFENFSSVSPDEIAKKSSAFFQAMEKLRSECAKV